MRSRAAQLFLILAILIVLAILMGVIFFKKWSRLFHTSAADFAAIGESKTVVILTLIFGRYTLSYSNDLIERLDQERKDEALFPDQYRNDNANDAGPIS